MLVGMIACSLALVGAAVAVGPRTTADGAPVFLGPLPYLCCDDSPLDASAPGLVHLVEDLEDGSYDALGATASSGAVVPPGPTTDSVDCDDGSIDGSGLAGHSWVVNGTPVLTVTFDAAILGALPVQAGIVFTDMGFQVDLVTFEAWDETGASLGTIQQTLGGGSDAGQTDEDRFFGITYQGGISAMRMTAGSDTNWEVDHIQYVFASDCPADVDLDDDVDVSDLLAVLAAWGPCDPGDCPACPEDVVASGTVDVSDLLLVLADWGGCPERGDVPPPKTKQPAVDGGLHQ
jgi:hypothetical protein